MPDHSTTLSRIATTIARAFEKLVQQALVNEELLGVFGLTELEARMARIDPGYARLCVTSRLDAYFTDIDFHFLEYNADTPAGVGDQMQLEKVLFGLSHVKELLHRYAHWRPEPHKRLLSALLDVYREWGGEEERPQIAIVDWKGVATESEFRILQQYFSSEGYETLITDPRELRYEDDRLKSGDFRMTFFTSGLSLMSSSNVVVRTSAARAYADVAVSNKFIPHKNRAQEGGLRDLERCTIRTLVYS